MDEMINELMKSSSSNNNTTTVQLHSNNLYDQIQRQSIVMPVRHAHVHTHAYHLGLDSVCEHI